MSTILILFAFNRPDKLRQAVAAVAAQTAKPDSIVTFVDGPRSAAEAQLTDECAAVASVLGQVVQHRHNLGCAHSIMYGIEQAACGFESFAVLEDDVLPVPNWYASMLALLDRYRGDPGVGSVGAFPSVLNGSLDDYGHDVILSPRFSCWGFGSWTAKWQELLAEWEGHAAGRGLPYDPAALPAHGGHDIGNMINSYAPGTLWDGVVAGSHLSRGWLQAMTRYYLVHNTGAGIHVPASKLRFMLENNPVEDRVPASFPPPGLDARVSAAVCGYVRAMG